MIPISSKQNYVSLKIRRITNLHPLLVRHDPYQLGGQLLDLVLLLAGVLLQDHILLQETEIPETETYFDLGSPKHTRDDPHI